METTYMAMIGRAPKGANQDYQKGHAMALSQSWSRPNTERPIALLLRGWLQYADEYFALNDGQVGDDGFIGPEWRSIGEGLRALLNGECGRIDCGTVDSVILDAMTKAGIDTSAL